MVGLPLAFGHGFVVEIFGPHVEAQAVNDDVFVGIGAKVAKDVRLVAVQDRLPVILLDHDLVALIDHGHDRVALPFHDHVVRDPVEVDRKAAVIGQAAIVGALQPALIDPVGATVKGALKALGVSPDRKDLVLNGTPVTDMESPLKPGDKLSVAERPQGS